MSMIDNLEAMLARGQDSKLLRLSLGNAYLEQGDADTAIGHLGYCLELDPQYSAAWRSYGKALEAAGRNDEATAAYREGATVAEHNGDKQAAKEMTVFARRLAKR